MNQISQASPLTGKLEYGATGIFEHIRNGEVINREVIHNLFPDESLVYALNVAFANSVAAGTPPTPFGGFYIALGTNNRSFVSTDVANDSASHPLGAGNGIHSLAIEFENYTEAGRPEWVPQVLATVTVLDLSNVGAEALFTVGAIGGTVDINTCFIMSNNDKTGNSDDLNARLFSGFKFANVKTLTDNDTFKVGYILKAQSIT